MCEAAVYLLKNGKQENLMNDVVTITPKEDQLVLTDILGKEVYTNAKIKEIDLLGHKVFLEEK